MPHKIVVSPIPVVAGQFVTICYIVLTGSETAELDVTFFDSQGQECGGVGILLSPAQPCVTIRVPKDADHGLVFDVRGDAEDALIQVVT